MLRFKVAILFFILIVITAAVFSYKILEIPGSLTDDESSFAYNGAVLAETAHDQNDRFLPVFVLASDQHNWRQPVEQYYLALFFKIFGPSPFNLRFASILVALLSTTLIFILSKKLFNVATAFFASLVFLTTPVVLIHSHLGLDNITTIPFAVLWLLFVYLFTKKNKRKYLVLAGISLGIGFYSYKAMRAIVPIWTMLAYFYILLIGFNPKQKIFSLKVIKNLSAFTVGVLPFIVLIPFFEYRYPGSIFDRQSIKFNDIYSFLYPYFSSFDLSFLYITGDVVSVHSTGKHGMLLLATLPLFLIGIYQSIKAKDFRYFWWLVTASFFLGPVLFGGINSIHRASRLLALIPAYILIVTLGISWLINQRKSSKLAFTSSIIICILMALNFFDFLNFYWFQYQWGPDSRETISAYKSFEVLAKESEKRNLTPYLSTDLHEGDSEKFFEMVYFQQLLKNWNIEEKPLPQNSILITGREKIPSLTNLNKNMKYYHLQISQ